MRAVRTMLVGIILALLLAVPAATSAQPEADGAGIPLALGPDGRLPLEGTPWRLEAYQHRDRDGEAGPEVAAFMRLGAGSLEGSGGCRRIRGTYAASGAAIEIRLRGATARACPKRSRLVQEAMTSGLRKASAWAIEAGVAANEDKLILRNAAGDVLLRFGLDDVAVLDASGWRLASYSVAGRTVLASAGQPAVLSFRADVDRVSRRRSSGAITASTGCNGLVGSFTRQADIVSFRRLELTDAPCTPTLAAQEAAIVAVLEAPALRLDLPYERLLIEDVESGARLVFESQHPLEGTTWLATGVRPRGSNARVTLRLEDGVASGEAPCGPFVAGYATDGVFITLRDLRARQDEDCGDRKLQRAFLDDLRRSVRLDRDPDRLRFLDAFGGRTVVFTPPPGG